MTLARPRSGAPLIERADARWPEAVEAGNLLDVARAIAGALRIWGCDLCMIDPQSKDVWVVASWSRDEEGRHEVMSPLLSFEHQRALTSLVVSGEAVTWRQDDGSLGPEVHQWMRSRRAGTAVHVPLFYGGSPTGILTLVERRPWQPSEDERRMLLAIAPAAAAALHNARLLVEQQENFRRLRSLLESIRAMTSNATLADVLDVVAVQAAVALQVPCTAIYELEGDDLVVRATHREPDERERLCPVGTRFPLAQHPFDQSVLANGEVVQLLTSDPNVDAGARRRMAEAGKSSFLSVPLVLRGDLVGILEIIETRWQRRFSFDERELARGIGEQAAAAIVNARLYREQERQNVLQRSLLETSKAIASSMALPEVLEVVAKVAADALQVTICVVTEYEAEGDRLVFRAGYDREGLADDEWWQTFTAPLDVYPGDRPILAGGKPVLELASDPSVHPVSRKVMIEEGTPTYLNVPLIVGGEVLGLLQLIERGVERSFTEGEIDYAASVGEQAAVAVQAARRYRQLLEATHDLENQLQLRHSLLELSEVLLRLHDMDSVLTHIASVLSRLVDYDSMDISLVDREANELVEVFEGRDHNRTLGLRMATDEGVSGDVLHSGRAELVNDMLRDPRAMQVPGTPQEEQASILVPLKLGNEIIGVLAMSRFEGRTFEQREFQLVQLVTNLAAIAIENARLYGGIQEKAARDGLTGLFNHRYFYERLSEEVARSRRYGSSLSLLMIDIDDFKRFNDRHGHLLGDKALQEVSACLLAEVRKGVDIVARYGGEEFAVLLPDMRGEAGESADENWSPGLGPNDGKQDDGIAGAQQPEEPGAAPVVAERIRDRIASHSFEIAGSMVSPLTVSVGIATLPDVAYDEAQLVDHADRALYLAKRLGKDRVEVYKA